MDGSTRIDASIRRDLDHMARDATHAETLRDLAIGLMDQLEKTPVGDRDLEEALEGISQDLDEVVSGLKKAASDIGERYSEFEERVW